MSNKFHKNDQAVFWLNDRPGTFQKQFHQPLLGFKWNERGLCISTGPLQLVLHLHGFMSCSRSRRQSVHQVPKQWFPFWIPSSQRKNKDLPRPLCQWLYSHGTQGQGPSVWPNRFSDAWKLFGLNISLCKTRGPPPSSTKHHFYRTSFHHWYYSAKNVNSFQNLAASSPPMDCQEGHLIYK